jgi:hypothetical protein
MKIGLRVGRGKLPPTRLSKTKPKVKDVVREGYAELQKFVDLAPVFSRALNTHFDSSSFPKITNWDDGLAIHPSTSHRVDKAILLCLQ